MSAKIIARRIAFAAPLVLLMMLAAACGIRVEIATPIVPSPTPRQLPDIDYSRGGIWRLQASPHVEFISSEDAHVQPFMHPDQAVIYTIQSRPVWMGVEYDVTWFAAAQSSAQIRLVVYTRNSSSDPWIAYDTAESNLTTGSIPKSNHDQISVVIYPEDVGIVNIRTEVSVIAYTEDGEISTQVNANELQVDVLADPGEISADDYNLNPAVGDWDASRLLMDWRAWKDGPCALGDQNDKTINLSCSALNEGDVQNALQSLRVALNQADSGELQAALAGQVGLLQTSLSDDDSAIDSFTKALRAYAMLGDAVQVEVALHNLFSVAQMGGNQSLADTTLQQLNDLRSLFSDEAGIMLTSANWGHISGESWRFDEPLSFFQDRDLSQAEIIQAWINQS